MQRPNYREMRDAGFALINAGRELERGDPGRTGRDDEMAGRMITAGAALAHFTANETPQRRAAVVEALRVYAEGVNEWAAHLNGDLK